MGARGDGLRHRPVLRPAGRAAGLAAVDLRGAVARRSGAARGGAVPRSAAGRCGAGLSRLRAGRMAGASGRRAGAGLPLLRRGGGADRGDRPLRLGRGAADARPGGAGTHGPGRDAAPGPGVDAWRPALADAGTGRDGDPDRPPLASRRRGGAGRLRFPPARVVPWAGGGRLHPQSGPAAGAAGRGAVDRQGPHVAVGPRAGGVARRKRRLRRRHHDRGSRGYGAGHASGAAGFEPRASAGDFGPAHGASGGASSLPRCGWACCYTRSAATAGPSRSWRRGARWSRRRATSRSPAAMSRRSVPSSWPPPRFARRCWTAARSACAAWLSRRWWC